MDTFAAKLKHSLGEIDARWPSVKFLSLGFYSAWILLMMNGSSIVAMPAHLASGESHNVLYLASGVPLCATLLILGAAHRSVHRSITHGPLVPCMGLLASFCTAIILGAFGGNFGTEIFVLASAGTGIGTAFVCVRIGGMYSYLNGNRIFFTVFYTAIIANLIYFMCAAIARPLALVVLSSLPFLAALFCFVRGEEGAAHDADAIPIEMLPRGFFFRCVAVVFVFALAVGVFKGIATLELPTEIVRDESIASVFASLNVKLALLVACALYLGGHSFDIGKIYYPIATIACLVILVSPLLGETFRFAQLVIVDASYNVFILAVWCILASIASQTTLSSTYVFGLGRGASAVGTTLGQFVAGFSVAALPAFRDGALIAAIVCAVIVLLCLQFVMGEHTVTEALEKTFSEGVIVVPASESDKGMQTAAREVPLEHWDVLCEAIAAEKGLTARESEILGLLSRGRTAAYISEELCISYNTAKGHIRNLYAKCDVHSRQELINMVEAKKALK